MRTEVEAPVTEPPYVRTAWRRRRAQGVRRRRGARRRRPARRARGELVAVVGPERLRRSRRCCELVCGLEAPDAGHGARAAGGADAAARRAAAVAVARSTTRRSRGGWRATSRDAARARRRTRTSRRSGWRASSARGRRRCRGGMRQRVAFLRTLLAGRPAAVPRRAVRGAGRADARAGAVLAGARRWRASRAPCCWSPTTSRRRCCSPTGSCCSRRARGASCSSSTSRCRARARGPTPRSSSCASARWPRWGWTAMKRAAPLASSSLALLVAVWELVVRAGWVDALLLPAPTQVAQSLWEDRALLAPGPAGDHVGGRARPRRGARARRRRSPWRCTSCRAVERALRPLVVGSQAVPIPVVAPLIVLVLGLRAGAEDPDHRADLLLPDRRQRRRRAARQRPRRAQAAALAGRVALAAAALPRRAVGAAGRRSPGMKIAAAVAVIGAVLAEWAGSDVRPRAPRSSPPTGSSRRARAFAATALLIAEAVALYAFFAWLERRVVDLGAEGMKKRLIALRGCWPSLLAGCGEKAEPTRRRARRARSRSR